MDAAKILDALAHAVKTLGVVELTAKEVAAMFQRLWDHFSPGEPEPSAMPVVALSAQCMSILENAHKRLEAE